MDRIKTGVSGLDELMDGGIPKGFNVLVVGLPGTGKTIMGLQYLVNGALNGENGIYISLDSPNELVKSQARQFGWDVDKLEKDGKITFIKIPLDKPRINLFDILEEEVKGSHAERLVFDSLADYAINIDQFATPLAYTGLPSIASDEDRNRMKSDKKYRYEVMPTLELDPEGRVFYKGHAEKRISYLLINELTKLGTTNLIITDQKQGGESLTIDGVSEYSADGVILFELSDTGGEILRTVKIMKMRNSKIDPKIRSFDFSDKGISLE